MAFENNEVFKQDKFVSYFGVKMVKFESSQPRYCLQNQQYIKGSLKDFEWMGETLLKLKLVWFFQDKAAIVRKALRSTRGFVLFVYWLSVMKVFWIWLKWICEAEYSRLLLEGHSLRRPKCFSTERFSIESPKTKIKVITNGQSEERKYQFVIIQLH